MTRTDVALVTVLGLVMAWSVAACTPDREVEPDPSPTVETPTPTPTPTEDAPDEDEVSAELPPGFPDPADVIGAEHVVEDGVPLFDGEPVELADSFGACFDGGTGEVCAYSLTGLVPVGQDGEPAPSEVTMLMLLSLTDRTADGRAIWDVVDARIVSAPDGEAAWLQSCDGEDGVAFYAGPDADIDGEEIPVAAAWGANPEVTGLVELDADDVTCYYMGP